MGIFVIISKQTTIKMYKLVALAALVAVAVAQFNQNQHGGQHQQQQHGGDHQLMHLIHNEVQALIQANAGMTSAECTSKCDAVFDMVDANDEQLNDQMCKGACECDIDHNCHHQQPTGHAGGHTPPAHH